MRSSGYVQLAINSLLILRDLQLQCELSRPHFQSLLCPEVPATHYVLPPDSNWMYIETKTVCVHYAFHCLALNASTR